jgi:hypothetical protein
MKSKILVAIGEAGANPAAGLNAALAANDRVKTVRSNRFKYSRSRPTGAGSTAACAARFHWPEYFPILTKPHCNR